MNYPRRGKKAKTIKSILRKKINDWLESIEDEAVREVAAKNTIVTGGCIASMLLGEPVNDFDLYFRTQEACKTVASYYVQKFNENPPPRFADSDKAIEAQVRVDDNGRVRVWIQSAGIASAAGDVGYEYFEQDPDEAATRAAEYVDGVLDVLNEEDDEGRPKYQPLFLTSNAITLSNKVQLVVRFHGEPDEIHENYDFVHVTNYWTSWNDKLVLRQEALESLLARELRYMGSLYPICSIIRTRKFVKRGWTINAGQYLKMCLQVGDLDLGSVDTLEDQLIGVDVAYFVEILEKLKERDKTRVDSTYLLEIIDRVF